MPELIIFLGVQLSGKTTLARALAQQINYPFLSIDNVRISLYGYLTGPKDWVDEASKAIHDEQTKRAYDFLFTKIRDYLNQRRSIIVEMPHLGHRENGLVDIVSQAGVQLKIIWCYISGGDREILERVKARTKDENSAEVSLEDYRMFAARIRKPSIIPFFELDTCQPQNICLEQISRYLSMPS